MPYLLLALLAALPAIDIFATFRVGAALNVPGWLLLLPGIVTGLGLLYRETRTAKRRFSDALASSGLAGMLFDSSRRLLAGLLLLAPGLISDVFALFLLLMPDRQPLAASASQPAAIDGSFRRVD